MENEDLRKNKILFDWLTVTVHQLELSEVFIVLGLEDLKDEFQVVRGRNGYIDCQYYDGISFMYNGREDMGICINFSGQGCRVFETYSTYGDFDELLRCLLSLDKTNITRLDVAYDDFCNYLPIEKIWEYTRKLNWVSPAGVRYCEYVGSCLDNFHAYSAYIGSSHSNMRIRFYDKGREKNVDYQWTRCELQMRDGIAESFVLQFLDLDSTITISDLFFGALNRYVRFIEPTATRKCRCPNTEWWDNFLETHNQIKLYTKCDVDYNIGRLSNYVINTCGNALQTYINIFGIPWLIEQLNSNRNVKDLPAKYRNQIKHYLRDYNDNRRTVERKLPDGEEIIEINEFPKRLENLINELQLNDRGEI